MAELRAPAAKTGSSKYEVPEQGRVSAVCCDVLDLGELPNPYYDPDKPWSKETQHMVQFVFQVEERNSENVRKTVRTKRLNLTSGEKSSLQKLVQDMTGRIFTQREPLSDIPLESLIGTPVMLRIVHVPGTKDGTVFANIKDGSIEPVGKTDPVLKVEGYMRNGYVRDAKPTPTPVVRERLPF